MKTFLEVEQDYFVQLAKVCSLSPSLMAHVSGLTRATIYRKIIKWNLREVMRATEMGE